MGNLYRPLLCNYTYMNMYYSQGPVQLQPKKNRLPNGMPV
jgi:hypothetical protein